MTLHQILFLLRLSYPNVIRVKWLHKKRFFAEFEIKNQGIGIYSAQLKKVILEPVPALVISIDDQMRWITYKQYPQITSKIINYNGEEIDFT